MKKYEYRIERLIQRDHRRVRSVLQSIYVSNNSIIIIIM